MCEFGDKLRTKKLFVFKLFKYNNSDSDTDRQRHGSLYITDQPTSIDHVDCVMNVSAELGVNMNEASNILIVDRNSHSSASSEYFEPSIHSESEMVLYIFRLI